MSECAICMEKTSNFTTECNHSFCCGCATEWLFTHNTCPMCRKEFYHISEEEIEEIEEINRQNELLRTRVYIFPKYKLVISVNLSEWGGLYVHRYLIFNIPHYDLLEPKLLKNINMRHRKTKHYRFDNTNFNHVETRY